MSGMVPRCGWCERDQAESGGALVLVGFVEGGSGPGWMHRACPSCVEEHRLVPWEEHPPDSRGDVRYRARTVR